MVTLNQQMRAVLPLLKPRTARALTMLAIDGHSAAGKTSFARALRQQLPQVRVVHMDDFYRPMQEAERASLDTAASYQRYYDWQRLEAQILIPLTNGQISHYQTYNWVTNQLDVWATVAPDGVVVVEGCYAARPELRHYYDAIILVATSAEQRERRQQARADASPEWLARWDAAERYYMDLYRPHDYADAIIEGE
jgi:uridine kinase